MATATVTPRRTTTPAPRAGVLPRRVRQAVLTVHILASGIWVGIDVLVAALVLAGRFAGSPPTREVAGRALATFVIWPMLGAGILCLASGVVLGIGTKWGLVRYRWVAAKLVLTVVLCLAIVFALRPTLGALDSDPGAMPVDLFFPPAVSLVVLSFATTISVIKPWGRLRSARDSRASSARPS